jgi:hypothetical protein
MKMTQANLLPERTSAIMCTLLSVYINAMEKTSSIFLFLNGCSPLPFWHQISVRTRSSMPGGKQRA